MILRSLRVRGWRNLAAASLEPGPRATVLFGDNGQGKTNLVEAAFFAATLAITWVVLAQSMNSSALAVAGAAFTIALAAAVCETLPLRIDVNLTIPLFVGFTTWIVAALFGVPLG